MTQKDFIENHLEHMGFRLETSIDGQNIFNKKLTDSSEVYVTVRPYVINITFRLRRTRGEKYYEMSRALSIYEISIMEGTIKNAILSLILEQYRELIEML